MLLIAMDRATVRRVDANGFLHVEVSNISKANVCPYYGREIPNWRELGLVPTRIYRLYRDPDELARAAASFNNVPLLSEHLPVIPEQLPDDLIIGSTGTDASFVAPYLRNSLVVWCAEHQRGIDERRKHQLSAGYRYRADMTPGLSPNGLRYDGVMRDIIGNHVALVFEGRAGPDVVVGDGLMKLTSRTALMISGAVAAMVRPLLAADARVDITDALKGVDAKSFAKDGAAKQVAGAVVTLVTPHLAADTALDADQLEAALAAVQPCALDEDTIADPTPAPSPAPTPAPSPTPSPSPSPTPAPAPAPTTEPPAMDSAAVQKLIADAKAEARAEAAAIDVAKKDVAPLVGEVVGLDSAEAIYRMALDSAGVAADAIKGAPLDTLKVMVEREVAHKARPMAQDRQQPTGGSRLAAIVPNLTPLIRS